MATYLVTGGCGFIGSHLADALLDNGHDVRILDDLSTGRLENKPARASLIEGDVADAAAVAAATRGVDGIFHLAAVASVERSNQDWLGAHRTNLAGTITVLDAARRAGASGGAVPVVYASSAAVFGANHDVPLTEDSAARPLSAYGADKLGSEHHAFVAGHVHGVPTCGLRFFNVYGPRQDPHSPYSGAISIFCERLKAGCSVTIHGDGGQYRDFVHVADVVRALRAAMQHAAVPGCVFNICTGTGTSILTLAAIIGELLSVTPQIDFAPPRAGEVRASRGDPTRCREQLGFAASVELRDGLRGMLAAET
jgi:UDP-glucose 4-epimerase